MTTTEALRIVLDLALENVCDETDEDMAGEYARQMEAINKVEELAKTV